MNRTRRFRWPSAAALGLAGLLGASEVLAVVGRPLTPMSYAGVARRTTRRAVYASAAVASTAALSTLPAGCVPSVYGAATYYGCGGTYYRPMYDGPNVVYVVATPPQ
jgi:hypothetical protein